MAALRSAIGFLVVVFGFGAADRPVNQTMDATSSPKLKMKRRRTNTPASSPHQLEGHLGVCSKPNWMCQPLHLVAESSGHRWEPLHGRDRSNGVVAGTCALHATESSKSSTSRLADKGPLTRCSTATAGAGSGWRTLAGRGDATCASRSCATTFLSWRAATSSRSKMSAWTPQMAPAQARAPRAASLSTHPHCRGASGGRCVGSATLTYA
mmetsp:Transcript_61000/g.170645  ORF Transcript_61000/g.170645 Transcript_61000/m.170645 type:complete len:210 (+) Transcript_61000:100-729(+)